MNIIVVGCGKVGTTLVKELVAEKHSIVVIDTDIDKLDDIGNTVDVMCVQGHGESVSVLKEAKVETCDLLIAMMYSDELNLLTCLIAKKLGAKNTSIQNVQLRAKYQDLSASRVQFRWKPLQREESR